MAAAPRGLLLFAHGARDVRWAAPFEAVADQVRASAAASNEPLQVRLAFLEFMQPGLIDAASDLVLAGCRRVDIVPLFLGAGGHVRKDLPVLVDALCSQHPGIEWLLRPAIGESDAVVAAMATASLDWVRSNTLEARPADAQASDSTRR